MRIPGIEPDLERGKRMRERREALKLSQREVAEELGVSLKRYWSWETEGAVISRPNLRALAEVLRTDRDYLLDGEESADGAERREVGERLDRIEALVRAGFAQVLEAIDGGLSPSEAAEIVSREVGDAQEALPGPYPTAGDELREQRATRDG